jgi:hypothetical protein
VIAFKHRRFTHGWEAIMGQTVGSGNADYPVDPDFDPLNLSQRLDSYPYFPRF